ncbi:ORF3' [Kafue kinda chacma baboon virus]|uniref:ORF3 n=1 Tax=Kafue kinda chacma baboon virus TaxID=1823757 RepID=A0A0Y0C1S2_9NIDO|nr:ORF3' [Kafue kinda chacma baboon virus]AMB20712.1 ORF3' [Kafue kinda chacma baboon virus]AMV49335.1 ORF3' protein [Kafue kinda chacma baboon virus]
MASGLHVRLISCLCVFYLVRSSGANINSTDTAPEGICFLLPVKHNVLVNISLHTLFCTNDGAISMEVDENHFGNDDCPLSGFKPHGSTTGKYGSFLHMSDINFPLNLTTDPSHVYITILLTYLMANFPQVLIPNHNTSLPLALNATVTNTTWQFCINSTNIPSVGSGPIVDLYTTGPPWGLYYMELLRPFLLSLLMLGLSHI